MKTIRASSGERRFLCPGSLHAEERIPQEPEPSEVAIQGIQTHEAINALLDGQELPDDLDSRQRVIAEKFAGLIQNIESAKPSMVMTEQHEVMLRDRKTEEPVWSGHPDRVSKIGNRVNVYDYKCGWLEQPKAASHVQLRIYVIALHDFFKEKNLEWHGHILSAANKTHISTVCFEASDIYYSYTELMEIARLCRKPDAKRMPGERQCKYCRARGTSVCPESIQELSLMPVPERLGQLPVAQLSDFYRAWKNQVKPVGEALEKHIRQLLDNDIAIPNLEYGEPGKKRHISDTSKAFNALSTLGVSGEDFAGKCKVSVGNIEKLVRDALSSEDKKVTVKEAKETTNELLTDVGAIEWKANKPPIVIMEGETNNEG